MIATRWEPIQDLPKNWKDFASNELKFLREIWKQQEKKLKTSQEYKEFLDKFKREFSIETSVIERAFSIERGVTQTLIEKGILVNLIPSGTTNKPAQDVVNIINDNIDAVEGLFDFITNKRTLSKSYIKELHQLLLRHQDTTEGVNPLGNSTTIKVIKGAWKKLSNNPYNYESKTQHQYCPPEHVEQDMDNLIRFHEEHQKLKIPAEVEAAWIHHRFAQIHPFQDGNGRVVRCIASLIFMKEGGFPLIIQNIERDKYIDALETADNGNLKPLVDLFVAQQIKAFHQVLKISSQVSVPTHEYSHLELIEQGAHQFHTKNELNKNKNQKILHKMCKDLIDIANIKFTEISKDFKKNKLHSTILHSNKDKKHWYKNEIIATAKEIGYWADRENFSDWIALKIKEGNADIVYSFHSYGREFSETIGVIAFIKFPESKSKVVCKNVFIVRNSENDKDKQMRFQLWLDETLKIALKEWRSSI